MAFSLTKTLPLAFRFWSLQNPIQKDVSDTVIFCIIPRLELQKLVPGSLHWVNNCYFQRAEFFMITRSPFNNLSQPFTVRPVGLSLDYERPRRWLDFCRSHHHRSHERSTHAATLREIPEVRVIDCSSQPYRIIKQPPSSEYVALSYVWGHSIHSEAAPEHYVSENDLPNDLPAVINDAIEVTLKLNFRFLWVDRWDMVFCNIPNLFIDVSTGTA